MSADVHPKPAFRFEDEAAMRAFIVDRAFAHLFAATPDGPMVAHVPVTPKGGNYRFHLARHNRIAAHLDGATVLASVAGPDGYVSPDWYAQPRDQVPTWNYVAVEIDGIAHALDEDALVEQIDVLSAAHEARLAPKVPWTRAKVASARLSAMYRAIQCFELRVTAMRATIKLSQNKSAADRAGVITALGDAPLARVMRAV